MAVAAVLQQQALALFDGLAAPGASYVPMGLLRDELDQAAAAEPRLVPLRTKLAQMSFLSIVDRQLYGQLTEQWLSAKAIHSFTVAFGGSVDLTGDAVPPVHSVDLTGDAVNQQSDDDDPHQQHDDPYWGDQEEAAPPASETVRPPSPVASASLHQWRCELSVSKALAVEDRQAGPAACSQQQPAAHCWQSLCCSVCCSADGTQMAAAVRGGNLWRSADYGLTWREALVRPGHWCAVACSSSGSRLLAASHGGGLWLSNDGGTSWKPATSFGGSKPWRADSQLQWTCACSSQDGRRLAAAAEGGSVWLSDTAGDHWVEVGLAGAGKQWSCICCNADGSLLAAAEWGGSVWCSNNSGMSWTEVTTMQPLLLFSSISCSASGEMMTAVASDSVWLSRDCGRSWAQLGSSSGRWRAAAVSADGRKIVAAADAGVFSCAVGSSGSEELREEDGTLGVGWSCVCCSADGSIRAAAGGHLGTAAGRGSPWTSVGCTTSLEGAARLMRVGLHWAGERGASPRMIVRR